MATPCLLPPPTAPSTTSPRAASSSRVLRAAQRARHGRLGVARGARRRRDPARARGRRGGAAPAAAGCWPTWRSARRAVARRPADLLAHLDRQRLLRGEFGFRVVDRSTVRQARQRERDVLAADRRRARRDAARSLTDLDRRGDGRRRVVHAPIAPTTSV